MRSTKSGFARLIDPTAITSAVPLSISAILVGNDCRVSGAINLLDAGVDESTVLKIGGWKTRAMLDRYNVLDRERVGSALTKAGKYVADRIAAEN